MTEGARGYPWPVQKWAKIDRMVVLMKRIKIFVSVLKILVFQMFPMCPYRQWGKSGDGMGWGKMGTSLWKLMG